MIAVIADDLTGAAEVGGVGLNYGLTVEVVTSLDGQFNCDLLVINTDTRSLSLPKAKAKTIAILEQLQALQPEFLFKKIDSVLRGHILAEMRLMMKAGNQMQSIVVAGNPSLKRTVKNGFYFVDGYPVHLTGFSNDPEFPMYSFDVDKMLRVDNQRTSFIPMNAAAFEGHFYGSYNIADIEEAADFNAWANIVNKYSNVLPVGTSLFFAALLKAKGFKQKENQNYKTAQPVKPVLYVSGTAFNKKVAAIKKIAAGKGPVSYPGTDLFKPQKPSQKGIEQWVKKTTELLENRNEAIIAFDNDCLPQTLTAIALRKLKATVVKAVFDNTTIKELIIEGGSTAAAILDALQFHRFKPVQELMPGVVRMQVDEKPDLFITIKPGSYPWPPGFWNFDNP